LGPIYILLETAASFGVLAELKPMAILLLPVWKPLPPPPASYPTVTLLLPVIMLADEFWPMAVLKLPVLRYWRVCVPTPMLHFDEASAETNTLLPIAMLQVPAA
jgi:hypothetical protein